MNNIFNQKKYKNSEETPPPPQKKTLHELRSRFQTKKQ